MKNLIYKIIRKFKSEPAEKKQPSNIVDSKVSALKLIDNTAKVQYSELIGSITVGPRSSVNKVLFDGKITIGANRTINRPGTKFYSIHNPITIGNFCSIARGTAVQEHNHDAECITTYFI